MVYTEEYHIGKRKGNTYLLMPGASYRVKFRGNERRGIFVDDHDQDRMPCA